MKSIDVSATTHSLGVMGYRCIKLPVVNIIQEHNVNYPEKYNKMYFIYSAISLSWLSAQTLNSQNQHNQEQKINPKHLAPVVQKVDSTIRWINLYPVDSAIGFPNTYPLDSDLSSGQRYPTFEQPGPGYKPRPIRYKTLNYCKHYYFRKKCDLIQKNIPY